MFDVDAVFTVLVLIVNVPVEAPAAIDTDEGTFTEDRLDLSDTTTEPFLADGTALRVT